MDPFVRRVANRPGRGRTTEKDGEMKFRVTDQKKLLSLVSMMPMPLTRCDLFFPIPAKGCLSEDTIRVFLRQLGKCREKGDPFLLSRSLENSHRECTYLVKSGRRHHLYWCGLPCVKLVLLALPSLSHSLKAPDSQLPRWDRRVAAAKYGLRFRKRPEKIQASLAS